MSDIVKHKFVSAKPDGPDATKLRPSNWNDEHAFAGGALGSLLYRDTGSSDGANWLASGAGVLACAGVGQVPAFRALVAGDIPALSYEPSFATLGLAKGGTAPFGAAGTVLVGGSTPAWSATPTLTQLGIGRAPYEHAALILERSVNDSVTTQNGIHNSLTQAGNAVAYAIENSLVHTGAISAAAFNNKVATSGSGSRDHIVATQNTAEHGSSGTLNWLYGSVSRLFTITGAGTVTSGAGYVALSPVLTRPVTTLYGVYIEDQVNAQVTNPWALYSEGAAPSRLSGPVFFGRASALGTTSTSGLTVENTTPATSGVTVQISPRIVRSGTAWASGLAVSRTVRFFDEVLPSTGATAGGNWKFGYINPVTSAITYPMILGSDGRVDFLGSVVAAQTLEAGATANIGFNARSQVKSPANAQLNIENNAGSAGFGFDVATDAVMKVRTRAQTGYATVDALGYRASGVAGVSFGPGPVSSITVVNGIVTAIS